MQLIKISEESGSLFLSTKAPINPRLKWNNPTAKAKIYTANVIVFLIDRFIVIHTTAESTPSSPVLRLVGIRTDLSSG